MLDSATAQRGSRLGRADSSTWQLGGASSRSSSIAFGESGDGYAERSSQLEMETWLLLEYCDMGTLMVSHWAPAPQSAQCQSMSPALHSSLQNRGLNGIRQQTNSG